MTATNSSIILTRKNDGARVGVSLVTFLEHIKSLDNVNSSIRIDGVEYSTANLVDANDSELIKVFAADQADLQAIAAESTYTFTVVDAVPANKYIAGALLKVNTQVACDAAGITLDIFVTGESRAKLIRFDTNASASKAVGDYLVSSVDATIEQTKDATYPQNIDFVLAVVDAMSTLGLTDGDIELWIMVKDFPSTAE
ncbi:MAG: hypothetical protein WC707_06940 [Candidatus Babeliaceae bacterium]|jgi:hypothetical protein